MEQLDYSKIIEKIGPKKDMTKLTEEEWLYYDMVRAIKSRSANDEKQIIQQAIKQYKQKGTIIKFNSNTNQINMKTSNKIWIGIAAGVAVLVVAYFFLSKPSMTASDMFAANYTPTTQYISIAKDNAMQYGMASSETGLRDSILKALEAYENNHYEEAIKILTPFVADYPENTDARFILARCYLNLAKYSPAITNLSILNATPDLNPQISEEVKWNLALTYLMMTDGKKQAKVLFEQLVKSEGKYSKTAKANLDMMQ